MNLLDRLIFFLEEFVKNKQRLTAFTEMIKTNNARVEFKLDEVTYVMNSATQHKEEIIKNGNFCDLCVKLANCIRSTLKDKIFTFENRSDWYYRYSLVLLQEMDSFHPIVHHLKKSEPMQKKYAKELVFYYGCVLGVLRFLEGVSWGYS